MRNRVGILPKNRPDSRHTRDEVPDLCRPGDGRLGCRLECALGRRGKLTDYRWTGRRFQKDARRSRDDGPPACQVQRFNSERPVTGSRLSGIVAEDLAGTGRNPHQRDD